jgi:hypothetical protein
MALTVRYREIAPVGQIDLLANPPQDSIQHREYQLALRRFHEYILDQAAIWGWRMDMSSEVVRIKAWAEANEPKFLGKYGKQQELKAEYFCGGKPFPFPEHIEEFADGCILELRGLLRVQRGEFARRRLMPRCERIAEWIKLEIETRPADFRHLYPYSGQLISYIRNHLPTRNPKSARELETGTVRADTFFYQWYAAATGRNFRDVQNQISLRRRQAIEQSSRK